MKASPIIFSGPMVRAILEGRKTQTRRVVKGQEHWGKSSLCVSRIGSALFRINEQIDDGGAHFADVACPYGQPGDRLWVREAGNWSKLKSLGAVYKATADMGRDRVKWMSPIHMPRWASRILLEIVSVRVERLNEISEEDAKAEGVLTRGMTRFKGEDARDFRGLWESINGPGSWNQNPWVWVVEFKKIEGKDHV